MPISSPPPLRMPTPPPSTNPVSFYVRFPLLQLLHCLLPTKPLDRFRKDVEVHVRGANGRAEGVAVVGVESAFEFAEVVLMRGRWD